MRGSYLIIYMTLSFISAIFGGYVVLSVALFLSMVMVHELIEIKSILQNGKNN